ncbi:hypothetical protein H8K35_10830 [Undibacterium sp. LX40W]|uniref:Secreted protein n=1 Tax=Undibacterium nitidum TaxID=2762298 RepID=A0A923HNV7_9BURK|nr:MULTISPECIES: hypothetical protein [Undibacterium]MBC3881848.1 hypothetical protein [Undibacterium nitidum]MBC3892155.1 hypothetical protein [Undibacterium sp. LX40W]
MQFIHYLKVLLCGSLLVFSGFAFAGKGSSSSSSMSRGFSSSRSAPSVSNNRPSSSSFGSFSKQTSSKSSVGGAFNRDLTNRQAQVNAMKNWDNSHRPVTTQASSGMPSLPNTSVGTSSSNTRYEPRPIASSPQVVQVPVTPSSGANMSGIMTGVVLGHVLSQPRTVYAGGSNNGQVNTNGRLEPITPEGEFKQSEIPVEATPTSGDLQTSTDLKQTATPVSNKEIQKVDGTDKSTGVLGWILIVGVIASVVWFARRRMNAAMQATNAVNTKPHYSL